ncbi:MAG: hypothetical protein NVSMB14_12230 [Isosphaeraceae bacterium]
MAKVDEQTGLNIPWGPSETIEVRLPNDWTDVESIEPDLSGAIEDYENALEQALDAPLESARLESLVNRESKIAIVVDDPSRWTPVEEALQIVLKRLIASGASSENISIVFGVGRHRVVDEISMKKRVGDEVFQRYRCFSPPLDKKSEYVELGRTSQGVPIGVFRPVAEADVRILIGSVLPHIQAGFGGGWKLIFPGTSRRETLGQLHRQGLRGDAGRLIGGDAHENPMRAAIREAANLLPGKTFSISHVLGPRGMVLRVKTGSVDAVQDDLAREAARRFRAPEGEPADLMVIGSNPWPGDPFQSFKVFLNHRAAARKDGVFVGFFHAEEGELNRSFPLPALHAIAATGAVGGAIARHGVRLAERLAGGAESSSAFMLRWARELIVDRTLLVFSPLLHKRIGGRLGPVRVFGDQAELWKSARSALESLGATNPRVRVFPRGGLTYATESRGR